MSSNRNSGDWAGPRRLPSVREKLSSFVRRGRGLAKKTTMSVLGEPHERASLDGSQKAFPRVQVQDFGTSSLEIDLQTLEAFRIAPQPEKPEKEPEQQKYQRTSSTTPIADMFARKTTSSPPATVRSSPPVNASHVNKTGRAPAEERRPSLAPSHATHASSSTLNVTILNSSHAQQSHTSRPWPPPEVLRVTASTRIQSTAGSDSRQPNRVLLREPRRGAFVTSTPSPTSRNDEKRYSTPTEMPSSTAMQNSLLAENIRTDRRRSWQPAPTSVPSGFATTSAPPSASAPWRGLSNNRRASARLGADRLGWIRELEEGKKNRSMISSDLPVLRTMQGGVADKLAKFESNQQQQAPLTRSNSTRSRTSSMADTTFSSYGGMATTRSSLDSHRTSSVFSHYDDSFREKMELIAGNANRKTDDDNEEKPALIRVTSTFVSVEKRNKQACVDKPHMI